MNYINVVLYDHEGEIAQRTMVPNEATAGRLATDLDLLWVEDTLSGDCVVLDGILQARPAPPPPGLEALRATARGKVAAARWEAQSQALDYDLVVATPGQMREAGRESVDLKLKNGWVFLTLAEAEKLATAYYNHVQDCYSAERVHVAVIDKATVEELNDYDYTVGWPTYTASL